MSDPQTMTETVTCKTHGIEFTREVRIPRDPIFESLTGCSRCNEEAEARRQEGRRRQAELDESQRHHRIDRLRQKANIPARFRGARFAGYLPQTTKQAAALRIAERYAAEFAVNLKTGRSLAFLGKIGTGKTMLGIAILNALTEAEFWVRYATASEIIREIRDTWNHRDGPSTGEAIEQFVGPQLLIVDEVGVGLGSESEIALLTEVFDLRYRANRPVLVVSNLDRAGLVRALGERAIDRIFEDGAAVLFDGESFRGKAGRLADAPCASEAAQ